MQVMIDTMVGIPKFSYPAKKNAPRPDKEFCSIQLIEQYPQGIPISQKEEDLLDPITGDIVGVVRSMVVATKLRFRILMTDTTGLPAIRIQAGWSSEVMKDLMIRLGYGFCSIKPISLEDALLEKDWEPRQGFSIEMYTNRYYKEEVFNIDYVDPITGNYYKGDIDVPMEIHVNP